MLYVQIFRTNVVFSSYLYVEKRCSYEKFVCKMLMKLTLVVMSAVIFFEVRIFKASKFETVIFLEKQLKLAKHLTNFFC